MSHFHETFCDQSVLWKNCLLCGSMDTDHRLSTVTSLNRIFVVFSIRCKEITIIFDAFHSRCSSIYNPNHYIRSNCFLENAIFERNRQIKSSYPLEYDDATIRRVYGSNLRGVKFCQMTFFLSCWRFSYEHNVLHWMFFSYGAFMRKSTFNISINDEQLSILEVVWILSKRFRCIDISGTLFECQQKMHRLCLTK